MLRKLLIAIIFCAFALPVFAGDVSGGDGDDELVCVVSSEYDNVCYAQGTTCTKDIECSNLLYEASLGCDVPGDRCMIMCNYCNTYECPKDGYPRNGQWVNGNDNVGYEKQERKDLDTTNMCQEIVIATQYRCAAGYYPAGDGSATTVEDLNCVRCPLWYGRDATSDAGATGIGDCRVAKGNKDDSVGFSDSTGSGIMWFDNDCNASVQNQTNP